MSTRVGGFGFSDRGYGTTYARGNFHTHAQSSRVSDRGSFAGGLLVALAVFLGLSWLSDNAQEGGSSNLEGRATYQQKSGIISGLALRVATLAGVALAIAGLVVVSPEFLIAGTVIAGASLIALAIKYGIESSTSPRVVKPDPAYYQPPVTTSNFQPPPPYSPSVYPQYGSEYK